MRPSLQEMPQPLRHTTLAEELGEQPHPGGDGAIARSGRCDQTADSRGGESGF